MKKPVPIAAVPTLRGKPFPAPFSTRLENTEWRRLDEYSGLGLAIADPDSRTTLQDVVTGLIVGNALLGVLFSTLLAVLRRWEQDLRTEYPTTEKYTNYSRRIYYARHTVIWLSVSQTIAILTALG